MRRPRVDTARLWRQMKEEGCQESRACLIELYEALAPTTRRRRFPTVNAEFADDMEAEGRLALVKAVDRYDPSRGVAFTSYAIDLIEGAMRQYLRQEDWVSRSAREKERAGEEVAIVELVSLEEFLEAHPDTALPSREAPVVDQVLLRLDRDLIRGFVRWLPYRESVVLTLCYWQGLTLKQTAATLGFSESRVHQIHHETLQRLRSWLHATGATCAL